MNKSLELKWYRSSEWYNELKESGIIDSSITEYPFVLELKVDGKLYDLQHKVSDFYIYDRDEVLECCKALFSQSDDKEIIFSFLENNLPFVIDELE